MDDGSGPQAARSIRSAPQKWTLVLLFALGVAAAISWYGALIWLAIQLIVKLWSAIAGLLAASLAPIDQSHGPMLGFVTWLQPMVGGLWRPSRWQGVGAEPRPRERLLAPEGDHGATSAHLERARQLLAEPGTWTQGAYARDRGDTPVDSHAPSAVRFCASGAIYAAVGRDVDFLPARTVFCTAIGGDIETWNDAPGRTHKEVVAAFDRAIGLARPASS